MSITWGDPAFVWGDSNFEWSLAELVTVANILPRSDGTQTVGMTCNIDLSMLIPAVVNTYFGDKSNIQRAAYTYKHAFSDATRTAMFENDGSNNFIQKNEVTFYLTSHTGDWALQSIILTDWDGQDRLLTGVDLPAGVAALVLYA
jgi:hypothetical protein